MYTYVYIYIDIDIYRERERKDYLCISMYIYIYTHINICICHVACLCLFRPPGKCLVELRLGCFVSGTDRVSSADAFARARRGLACMRKCS